jgi:acyl-CoA thioester hydrolase|tara:strand:- start:95 stop:532 length:438 start_codon:yes stop_codon:yes gene_type:complete
MSKEWRTNGRECYKHYVQIPTRWMDNDIYLHVNNVNYYSFFDTVIGLYLIDEGRLNIVKDPVVGFCVESSCNYFKPLQFPEVVDAGLRVAHLGRSSARYEIGLFRDQEESPSAAGYFVHTFVSRSTHKPHKIPEKIRNALEKISS